jgi:hypothetical protein
MIVEIVLAVVLLVTLVVSLLALRRIQQLRRGGVDVALRRTPTPPTPGATAGRPSDRRWRSGIGLYRGNQFRLFRVAGLRSAPRAVLDRTEVEIVDRRTPVAGEMHAPGATVLVCRTRGDLWEVAMAPDVLTGFSSWLESTPPGRTTGYRQAS